MLTVKSIDNLQKMNETCYSQKAGRRFVSHSCLHHRNHLQSQHVGFHWRPVQSLNVSHPGGSSLDIATSIIARHSYASAAFASVE